MEQLQRANGRCEICQNERKLVIDHDHQTGQFRGLLCSQCNTALGMFYEQPDIMLDAIQYPKQKQST